MFRAPFQRAPHVLGTTSVDNYSVIKCPHTPTRARARPVFLNSLIIFTRVLLHGRNPSFYFSENKYRSQLMVANF
jgi:hypothetical protein